MRCAATLFSLTGELAFAAGILLQFYAFLAPVPWFSDGSTADLRFVPYVEPQGYTPPNPCSSSSLSNSTISLEIPSNNVIRAFPEGLRFRRSQVLRERESDGSAPANVSQIAVWLGPLGSCSRDADGSLHCTKPSYGNPQYNMTYIQDNSVYFPEMMPQVIKRTEILAVIVLNCLGLLVFLCTSLPFWFPSGYLKIFNPNANRSNVIYPWIGLGFLGLSFVVQFFVNFSTGVTRVNSYNSIDNFYLPAACGMIRPLKSGILLRAETGSAYHLIWAGWCVIFLYASLHLFGRASWVASPSFDKAIEQSKQTAQDKKIRKEEKAAEKLRKQVDNEKIKIIATEQLQAERKAQEAENSVTSTSSVGSAAAPPYLSVNIV